jgi:uncharacterized YigZ family protein
MEIPVDRAETILEAKKSKFIAIACPCPSLEEARQLVARTKALHPDASHVVHAAVIGPNGDEFSYSDDHEPKNTAGRPVLEVLKGSGVTNVAVLVIRYFGGTLLGTGGLVKAYGESARKVLAALKTEPLVEKCSFRISMAYDLYEPLKKALEGFGCAIEEERFESAVTIAGTLPAANRDAARFAMTELSNGRTGIVFTG